MLSHLLLIAKYLKIKKHFPHLKEAYMFTLTGLIPSLQRLLRIIIITRHILCLCDWESLSAIFLYALMSLNITDITSSIYTNKVEYQQQSYTKYSYSKLKELIKIQIIIKYVRFLCNFHFFHEQIKNTFHRIYWKGF